MAVSFDTQRLLSEMELERQEDWRELSETRSVRIQDMILTVRNAIEDAREQMAQAQAQAEAAAAQAQAAAEQASAMAEQAQHDAEAALAQAVAAAESAKEAAAQAQALLDEASAVASAAASEAAAMAQQALGEANDMLAAARQMIEDLLQLPVALTIDAELEARLQAVMPELSATTDLVQGSGAQHSGNDYSTVLLPTGELEGDGVAGVNALGDAAAASNNELVTLLAAASASGLIPEDLAQRVAQITTALGQADMFEAAGHTQVAAQLRAAWEPIAQALLEELGLLTAPASNGVTTTTDTVTATGGDATSTTTESATVELPPVTLLPANDYASVVGNGEPIGGGFYGVGDNGRNGQDSLYEWLPQAVADAARASNHGHFLLTSSDQVTTVQQHLLDRAVYPIITNEERWDEGGSMIVQVTSYVDREAAIAHLIEAGKSASEIEGWLAEHDTYMLTRESYDGEGGSIGPTYGGRADYLAAIGLPADVPLDLQIAFNNSGSGGGDAWLFRTEGNYDLQGYGYVGQAYHALVDNTLAEHWVQIGDIGPLGDDIGRMLGDIFNQYGADTPEKQEIIRSLLFRYDERFGILANREFIAAAVETNNNRRQGFLERGLGRAILSIAVSFIPGAGPALSAALNAAFTLADGGSFVDALRAGLAAYAGGQVGNWASGAVNGALSGTMNATLASALAGAASGLSSSAVSQLIQTGRIDGRTLLASGLSGGVSGAVTQLVSTTDFARSLDTALGVNPGTTARLIGGQAGSLATGNGLSATSLIATLGGGYVQYGDASNTGSAEEVLDTLSGVWPSLSDADISALEEANFGLGENTTIVDELPEGVGDLPTGLPTLSDADISRLELERQGYTRDEVTGLETWRNPESGAIVFQRAPDGSTLAVTNGTSVMRDGLGHVVAVEGGRFGEAFAMARASGAATFLWNGASYATVTREDILRSNGGDVNDYRAYVRATGNHSLEGYAAHLTNNKWETLANAGIDASFWQARGFTPEQVASFYVLNGNDHRLTTIPAGTLPGTTSDVDLSAFYGSGLNPELDPTGTSTGSAVQGRTWGELFRDGVSATVQFGQNLSAIAMNWDRLPPETREDLIAAGIQMVGGLLYIPGAIDGVRLMVTGSSDLLGRHEADGVDYGLAVLSLVPGGRLAGLVGQAGDVVASAARAVGHLDEIRTSRSMLGEGAFGWAWDLGDGTILKQFNPNAFRSGQDLTVIAAEQVAAHDALRVRFPEVVPAHVGGDAGTLITQRADGTYFRDLDPNIQGQAAALAETRRAEYQAYLDSVSPGRWTVDGNPENFTYTLVNGQLQIRANFDPVGAGGQAFSVARAPAVDLPPLEFPGYSGGPRR